MAKPIVITLKNTARDASDGRDGRDGRASRSRSPRPGVMDLAALEGHVTKFQEAPGRHGMPWGDLEEEYSDFLLQLYAQKRLTDHWNHGHIIKYNNIYA
jgi:hypothetical protein